MANAKKAEKRKTNSEGERFIALSDELLRLTTTPAIRTLSPKKHDKLLRHLDKVDRSVAKMTKLVRVKHS